MAISGWQLNRFERILLRIALLLASLLVLARLGTIVFLALFHHSR